MTTQSFDAAKRHDAAVHKDHSFFGHPRGLFTLSALEVWERFSYLGFQAILALYFSAAIVEGGLGYEESTASSIVAAYGALVYLLSIVGAWISDRMTGNYRAVLFGAIIIAAGHIAMGVPTETFTWIGLGLIIVGTGLLKPNVASQVGELYSADDQRRDSGFSIYYAGINIGAFLGPLVVGWLGQNYNWHWGFSAAAVGMVLGVIQYVMGSKRLGGKSRGMAIRQAFTPDKNFWLTVSLVLAIVAVGVGFSVAGDDALGRAINLVSLVSALVPIVFLLYMYRSPQVNDVERRNLLPYTFMLIALVMYNLTYFQTGNTLNFVALERTNNVVAGFEYPSTWYISLTAIVEIIMGPVLAWLWIKLGSKQPNVAAKVGIGTVLGGVAFLLIALGATITPAGALLSAGWLVGCYIFLGLGDLILQTSGMSATTKLAPKAFKSMTMAMWFAAMAMVQGIQAQIVKLFTYDNMAIYFGIQAAVIIGYGLLLIALTPWLSKRMSIIPD